MDPVVVNGDRVTGLEGGCKERFAPESFGDVFACEGLRQQYFESDAASEVDLYGLKHNSKRTTTELTAEAKFTDDDVAGVW